MINLALPRSIFAVVLALAPSFVPDSSAQPSSIKGEPLAKPVRRTGPTLFTELSGAATGVITQNNYDDPRMWSDRFHEFEVGAIGTGVAIGDYDNDGRPDIFVVSKTESCRLFHNLGNWKFEDVTSKAGVEDLGDNAKIWKQGVTFVDVNNDGLLDIYVCRFGAANLLYINQGNGTFKEEAAARGLALVDASVMASFCDYDRDGWLDVFIQTNLLDSRKSPNGQRNHLFHNNRDGTFTEVSDRAGITGEGQGHSAIWWDFDGDGWPDLYVTNDFSTPDKLYHNNHDGTFTNVIDEVVPHMPFSSMGSDLGDVNNDGYIDFFASDMAATSHQKDERSVALMRRTLVDPANDSRTAPQSMRNALYINTGLGRCLEAACLAGLSATDWTWSVRLEDLDNDGKLDLFVTNGTFREMHNADLTARKLTAESFDSQVRMERDAPILKEKHLAFRNEGNLNFKEVSAEWGLNHFGVSFGTAFGDLDGDGDLDVVYTNYLGGATILRNDSDTGHRVIFSLRGTRSNRFGIGAVVRIETKSGVQVRPITLARGLLSSSEPIAHFGLGDDDRILRLSVSWPSGIEQHFENLAADQHYTINEEGAPNPEQSSSRRKPFTLFQEVSNEVGLGTTFREAPIDELIQQPLLPMRQNRRGPALAIAPLSDKNREDIVISGTTRDALKIFSAGPGGKYQSRTLSAPPNSVNDGPILAFDANGDGAIDLLLTKSGEALPAGADDYRPQLWLNDGHGHFRLADPNTLPDFSVSAGAVAAADVNHDGMLDVFIGGRVIPGHYPETPASAVWMNRGGHFEDVTDHFAPALRRVGLVTSALWTDVDGDGWADLVLTLEWGQVKYFHNRDGQGLDDWSEKAGFARAGNGWWTSIASADFNHDGHPDFVVGNVGLNTPYQASAAFPAMLYSVKFSEGRAPALIEACYENGKLYPRRTRRDLSEVIPGLLKRFPRNDFFARATLEEIIGADKLQQAKHWHAEEFRSGLFLSQPDGTYIFEPLPRMAQIAPLQGIAIADFDGDGRVDILAVQNSFAPIPSIGRFDGGLGLLLRGDNQGHFEIVPADTSGVIVPRDAKALAVADINHDGWPDFIVSRNNDTPLVFLNRGIPGRKSRRIHLESSPDKNTVVGARVTARYADGTTETREVTTTSSYYSQSSPDLFFGERDANPLSSLIVSWPNGATDTFTNTSGETTITCRQSAGNH